MKTIVNFFNYKMTGTTVALSLGLGGVVSFFYNINPLLQCLLILMSVDIFSGVSIAFKEKNVESNKFGNGITKKMLMLAMIYVAFIFDTTLIPFLTLDRVLDFPLISITTIYYITYELSSIIENFGILGIPIPTPIKNILKLLKKDE